MINIEVREFKIKIDNKEYTFRLDFEALIKFDKKYGLEGMELFNKFLSGNDTYECIIKILSCSCIEKEWEEEELKKGLSFNFNTMRLFDEITFTLAEGLINDDLDGSNKEKN
ncbi:hypothetical protein [Clostridium peptidivorans]|uniref:hypothetical protein n=1 Tax=Clostridium peptidivorans TaxID=100174 RepID=UPI000BE3813F|nr:hypothetical protein [Clostridium peptidivorans]